VTIINHYDHEVHHWRSTSGARTVPTTFISLDQRQLLFTQPVNYWLAILITSYCLYWNHGSRAILRNCFVCFEPWLSSLHAFL